MVSFSSFFKQHKRLCQFAFVFAASIALDSCSLVTEPEPPTPSVAKSHGANGMIYLNTPPPTYPSSPSTGGGNGGGGGGHVPTSTVEDPTGGPGDGGDQGDPAVVYAEEQGSSEAPSSPAASLGDYRRVCIIHGFYPTVDLRALVEITKATHTIEKITIFWTGVVPPGATLVELGDGIQYGYNANTDTYSFSKLFQITGLDASLNSRQLDFYGEITPSTGGYNVKVIR